MQATLRHGLIIIISEQFDARNNEKEHRNIGRGKKGKRFATFDHPSCDLSPHLRDPKSKSERWNEKEREEREESGRGLDSEQVQKLQSHLVGKQVICSATLQVIVREKERKLFVQELSNLPV